MKYVPAFGGHCTHGLSTVEAGQLTAEDLVDGRLSFVCVNTTTWGTVVKGKLYLTSCGSYEAFMRDQSGDIAKASAVWGSLFGSPYIQYGPVNDACFQDGYQWK